MARQSVESLLAWMKDISRLSGWDGLVALSSDKVNEVLHQSYLFKLSDGALQVPDGSVPVPNSSLSHYFAGFALGAPVLNLEHASLQSSDIALRLPVVAGVHTLLERSLGVNRILKLSVYDPLSGPALGMNLPARTTSSTVELDLAQGTDLLLQFAGTAIEQSEGGKYFKAWLNDPATVGQVYPLGSFDYQDNTLLQVRRVDVGFQREDDRRAPQSDPAGAMLLFLTMQHGITGGIPGNPADWPYLIPDDADQPYSATAIFSQHLLHRAAFGHAVMQLLEAGEFDFIEADGEPARQMVARAGRFEVPAGGAKGPKFMFESEAFSLNAGGGQQPLTVAFENNQALQHWQFTCTVKFKYKPLQTTDWTHLTGSFAASLNHEFNFVADELATHGMEGHLFVPYTQRQEVTALSGLPMNLDPAEREHINGFIGYTIKRALLEAFSKTLTATVVEPFLEQWKLEGGWGFSPLYKALPQDQALFGRLHGVGSSFAIVQQRQVVRASAQVQFSTEPARQNLVWSLEPLPGNVGDLGRIDASGGEYRAPPARTITDSARHVLVLATDTETRETSAALVTIVADPISIHPLIQVCNYGEKVKLAASSLDEGLLQWTIKNPVAGESGRVITDEEAGGDHIYAAANQVSTKTYVLDEIEVSAAGETQSAWVLVLQRIPQLQVLIEVDESLLPGQVRLQAFFLENALSGVEWSVPAGRTDSIDANGIYTSDPGVRDRFVVIFAKYDGDFLGILEGHMILPLPLEESSAVLQALAR